MEYKIRGQIPPKPIDGSDEYLTVCCIIYEQPHEHFVNGSKEIRYLNDESK